MALLSKRFLPAFTRLWYFYVCRANAPTEVACDQSWIRSSPRAFISCKPIFQTLPKGWGVCVPDQQQQRTAAGDPGSLILRGVAAGVGIVGTVPGLGAPAAEPEPDLEPDLNQIELGPVGKRGAAAALARLEEIEERAHARLMRAIEHGNPFTIKSCQEFYLRSSETLRRLDAAVECERRAAGEQIPMRQIEDVSAQISTWLRLAFEQFLSSQSQSLMGIKDLGEFKFFAIERFRGVLHTVVKSSIKTNSAIPSWASAPVIEAWNVPSF
jgi:hypothetical protein